LIALDGQARLKQFVLKARLNNDRLNQARLNGDRLNQARLLLVDLIAA
jgi:hypothetical protein